MIATMLRGSGDLSRWLLLAGLLCYSTCQTSATSFENKTDTTDNKPRVFSPRMDYDEWTPLGRGDPLKNNPTFDYVPPVLDRVQYWLDSHTTEPSTKRDILVLGVTAKKTSPKIPEQFLKFVDGPKFTRTSQQDTSYRNDFTGSTGAEPPKVLRTTNFRNGVVDYRNQNRIQSLPASYYPSPYYGQKMKPYTMMLPPPIIQKQVEPSGVFGGGDLSKEKLLGYVEPSQHFGTQTEEGPVLQDSPYYELPAKTYNQHHLSQVSRPYSQAPLKVANKNVAVSQIETIKSIYTAPPSQSTKSKYEATTSPSVSFEKSNLIYQSTQTISNGWLANNGPTSSSTLQQSNQATWQTPDYSRDHYDIDYHAAGSANHEVVVGQNTNIIVDGESNEKEEVVLGQKGAAPSNVSSSPSPMTSAQTDSTTDSSVSTPTPEMKTQNSSEQSKEETEGSPKMHIVVANSPSSVDQDAQKDGAVAVIMPTNYVEKKANHSASKVVEVSPMPALNLSKNSSVTSESVQEEQQQQQQQREPMPSEPQLQKITATSSSMFLEDPSPSSLSIPNRMMPPPHPQSSHQLSHMSLPSSHHPANPTHMFASSQVLAPMHSQTRPNHGMMQFIGSMRPNNAFRPSPALSMSHMSPPMAHMHAPPMKNMMNMEQLHQRPPQMQLFPLTFTNAAAAPSTLTAQTGGETDEHRLDQRQPGISEITTTAAVATASSSSQFPSASTDSVVHDSSSSSSSFSTSKDAPVDHSKTKQSPSAMLLTEDDSPPSKKLETNVGPAASAAPQTTTVASFTTDPIFSHYKQPAKPIRGPMYLIIQGHSKVKTYKPTVNKHGVPIEKNVIADNLTEKPLSKFEQLIRENTKNGAANANAELEKKKKLEEKIRQEKLASTSQENLMSLVESGLGAFTVPPSSSVTEKEERIANSVATIEINAN